MAYKDFKKGHPKKGGRKKGTPNKFTTLRKSFLDAFQDKRIGGTEGLIQVFSKNDIRKIDFFKLISKMLPTNITANLSEKKIVKIEFVSVKKKKDDKTV